MKLLFVHSHKFRKVGSQIYSIGGLNEQVLSRYCKYCEELTVIARIVCEEKAEGRWSEITDHKIKILGNTSMIYPYLKEEIEKCDKMIVRLPSIMGVLAININKKIGKPYFVEMVGCPWDALWNHSIKGKFLAPVLYMVNKAAVKNAPYVLYVTEQFLQKRYPTTGKNIGCSDVVLTDFDDGILNKRLEKISNHTGKIILGTLAAVDVKYKGQQYVIEAMGRLKKQGITQFEYQLAGNGDTSFLRAVAEKNDVLSQVKFLGGIPHENVNAWFDSIDIYIQPSKQEGLPRALIEAMSRAVPSLGSNVGGIPELLDSDCIFQKGNVSELHHLLAGFTPEKWKKQYKRVYFRAKDFETEKLNQKRNQFYEEFYNS